MSLSAVLRWYNKIPPAERDMPLIPYGGKLYSPNEVLREVKANTPVGKALQAIIEAGHLTSYQTLKEIAKARLIWMLQHLPPGAGFVSIGGRTYTAEEMIKLIKEEKYPANIFIEHEIQTIEKRMRP